MDGSNNVEVFNMTSLNDVFNGTAYAETIYAGAGNDTIKARRGLRLTATTSMVRQVSTWVNYLTRFGSGDTTHVTYEKPTTVVVGSAVDTLSMLRTSPPPTSMTRLLPQLRAV